MPHVEAYSSRNCPDGKPFQSVSGIMLQEQHQSGQYSTMLSHIERENIFLDVFKNSRRRGLSDMWWNHIAKPCPLISIDLYAILKCVFLFKKEIAT